MNGNGLKSSGRSSSQRSINDYPEHLNPFYEDENHKRLRFWKIRGDKTSRSNSFSIDGLKGLWSFKTFKLKKKSSATGINKTSESPPMLRREENQYGSQATYDSRMRHTVDIGLDNNFQRGAACRSSLQDLNSMSRNQGDNYFVRNNRYRSTMQPSGQHQDQYQSNQTIGSVTPMLRSRFNQPSISRGSSQLSVNSSNPFDDEYDTISQVGSPERSSIRRSGRKKRRAPAPPVSVNNSVATVEESSEDPEKMRDSVNFTNLTAEIESFVRTADSDTEKIEKQNETTGHTIEDNSVTKIEKTNVSRQSPENNDYYPQEQIDSITIEKIENLGATDVNSNERCKKSPVKILIRAPTEEEPISIIEEEEPSVTTEHNTKEEINTRETETKNEEIKFRDGITETTNQPETKIESVEHDSVKTEIKIELADEPVSPPKVEINEPELEITQKVCVKTPPNDLSLDEESKLEKTLETDDHVNNNSQKMKLSFDSHRLIHNLEESTTPTSSAVEFILEQEQENEFNFPTVLKITESNEDLTQNVEHESKSINKPDVDSSNTSTNSVRTFEVRTIPLKLDSPKSRKSNAVANKEPPTPPQRRRSVKEIIASINKCQSLLKVNQDANKVVNDQTVDNMPVASSSKFNSFGKSCQNSDLTEVNNNGRYQDVSNIPLFVEKFDEYNNNGATVIFEKCNPRADKRTKDDKLEWNPVPKPRRHRHSLQGSIN